MIYMIPQAYDGCFYYRILLPARANGFYTPKISLRARPHSDDHMLTDAKKANIVVWHRPTEPQQFDHMLWFKDKGAKIVVDNDDTYKTGSGIEDILGRYDDYDVEQRGKNLRKFMKYADLVTTTTEFLANEYREVVDNVKVLPNMIDPLDWDEPKENTTGEFRIGILGSVVTSSDWRHIAPLIEQLSEREDIELVLQGAPDKYSKSDKKYYKEELAFWSSLNAEWNGVCPLEDYMGVIAGLALDLVLIPRKDNYFNRCKSNCKWLEMANLGIPVIAQKYSDGLSPYEIDAKHILLADSLDEWSDQVQYAISNRKEIRKMAKKAKKFVLKNYSVKRKAHLWVDAYESLTVL